MVRFVLSRIGQTLAVLFTVSVIIFALMRMIPGDPALMRLGDDFTQEAYDRLRGELGFDRSIVMQYLIWLGQVLSGDLGNSYLNHERVSRLVLEAFVPTLILVVASVVVGILIAVPSGIVAAMRKDSLWDYGSMGFAIFVYSMPSFWKGIILIWIFSVYLGWFPAMGYVPPWTNLTQGLWRLVLPAVTLGTFFSGLVARIIRSSLLEVLDQDYVKAARARGVRRAALVYKHALANALIPVVTVIGLQFGTLLGGAVLTETVFAIPRDGAALGQRHPEPGLLGGAGHDPGRRLRRGGGESPGRSDLRVPQPEDPGGLDGASPRGWRSSLRSGRSSQPRRSALGHPSRPIRPPPLVAEVRAKPGGAVRARGVPRHRRDGDAGAGHRSL
jgi:peptide/nickel transport system permease protein